METKDNVTKLRESANGQPSVMQDRQRVDEGELAELNETAKALTDTLVDIARNDREMIKLSIVAAELKEKEKALHDIADRREQSQSSLFQRLMRKYQLPNGATINFGTGFIYMPGEQLPE